MEVPERITIIGGSILLSSLLIFGLKGQANNLLPKANDSVNTVYQNISDPENSIQYSDDLAHAKSQSRQEAIQKLYGTAQKIAPQYHVLPSVVLADAGSENPNGTNNNYWGVGADDNTTANNQSYDNVEDGMRAFLNNAIKLTDNKVQSSNAKDALQAMADADGNHPPEKLYHSDDSLDYGAKLFSQYNVYNLGQYDKNIDLNNNN